MMFGGQMYLLDISGLADFMQMLMLIRPIQPETYFYANEMFYLKSDCDVITVCT